MFRQHQPTTLLRKRLWYRCFSVNFATFLRTPFFPPVAAPWKNCINRCNLTLLSQGDWGESNSLTTYQKFMKRSNLSENLSGIKNPNFFQNSKLLLFCQHFLKTRSRKNIFILYHVIVNTLCIPSFWKIVSKMQFRYFWSWNDGQFTKKKLYSRRHS